MNEKELEKQMKKVIQLNREFQKEDFSFTKNIKIFFKLSDEQTEKLFTDFDDIVDSLQYATGSITWNIFKKHIEKVKEGYK